MSKATIVPGVHDHLPPDGRITLELLHPETGRVRKRVRTENALMDWFRKNTVMNGGRGEPYPQIKTASYHAYDHFDPMNTQLPWNYFWDKPYGWPTQVNPNVSSCWLWATDQNVTPDATKHMIPANNSTGDVTAGVDLNKAFAPDGLQFKRGGLQLGSCLRTWDRTRIVAEFGLAYGNGIYRSIGIGSLIGQKNAAGMRATPVNVANAVSWNYSQPGSIGVQNGTLGSMNMYWARGCVDYTDGGLWGFRSIINTGLNRLTADSTSDPVQLVSLANMPGAGGQVSVAVNGTDFWIGRNQGLYRCVKPTSDVAMTVTDTYNLAGTLGAQTILDIVVNRTANKVYLLTSSHVHIIDGVTGAPDSNFAHGITYSGIAPNTATIEWSAAESLIIVTPGFENSGSDSGWGAAATPSSLATEASCYVKSFTTAGTPSKGMMLAQYGPVNTNNQWYGNYCMLNDWGMAQQTRLINGLANVLYGPSMASHALLGADVEKTSADALRITYDFDFV